MNHFMMLTTSWPFVVPKFYRSSVLGGLGYLLPKLCACMKALDFTYIVSIRETYNHPKPRLLFMWQSILVNFVGLYLFGYPRL